MCPRPRDPGAQFTIPSVRVNLSHQQVRPLKARFLDHVSLWIDDLRTPETRKVPVLAGDVGADHPNPMLGRQCDVRTSRRGIQFQRSPPVRQAVVGWMKRTAAFWTAMRRAKSG